MRAVSTLTYYMNWVIKKIIDASERVLTMATTLGYNAELIWHVIIYATSG